MKENEPKKQIEQSEKEPEEIRENTTQVEQDIDQAAATLPETQAEKPVDDKPGFVKRNWKRATAIALVAGAGHLGIKKGGEKLGLWGNDDQKGEIGQNYIKKETNKIYTVPATTNLTALAEEVKKTSPSIEEIERELVERQRKINEINAEIDRELQNEQEKVVATTKATLLAEKEKINIELVERQREINEIKAKIDSIKKTKDEGVKKIEPNFEKETATKKYEMTETPHGAKSVVSERESTKKQDRVVKPAPPEFKFYYSETAPNIDQGGKPLTGSGSYYGGTPVTPYPRVSVEKVPLENHPKNLNNPSNLTPKILEKVEEVYEENLEKIFPKDTLKNWRSIKDAGAYEFMSTPDSKVKKVNKPLHDYLKKLSNISGLKPKSGILEKAPESIEAYMGRTLQKAIQEGKIAELKK